MRRRGFLLGGLAGGGALLVGWGVLPPRDRAGGRDVLAAGEGEVALNGWLKLRRDGSVALAMPRSEMGQGVHSGLAMLVAEELELPLEAVHLVPAGPEAIYGNVAAFVANLPLRPPDESGYGRRARAARFLVAKVARELGLSITGGSASVVDAWEPLRLAAATVRAQLLGAAALQWKLPVAELGMANGTVRHPSGLQAHYGELAAAAAGTPVSQVKVKPREAWQLIGQRAPRVDLEGKVDGSARFGIDVRPEGLLHASLRMSPSFGGTPEATAAELDALLQCAGVERVVRLPALAGADAGIAVVARSWWQAEQALRTVPLAWRAAPGREAARSARAESRLEQAARDGHGYVFFAQGDAEAAYAQAPAPSRLEAVYHAPYLAHAALEPMNCTARVAEGRVELWASTQVPSLARETAARVAGVAPDQVTLHVPYLGGGFGRRLETDAIAQAVRIALETGGRPVQLVWPREEDLRHDFYRPAGCAVLRAVLDPRTRQPLALVVRSAGDAVVPRWVERNLPAFAGPVDAPDRSTSEGLFDLPYEIPQLHAAHVATSSGIPVGYWRSVGHSHNAFFLECFVDELAEVAGQDPLAFRLGLLAARPRHAAVLRLAAERAGWGGALAAGRAHGLALHESFGSIAAQVHEVALEPGPAGQRLRVHRVVCAIDCGTAVNPALVAQQVESGVVFGLSAALYGRIEVEQGRVRQANFPDQPLLGLAECPLIETHVVPSLREPGGVGEVAVPPVAPALANAFARLTGRRSRSLPLVA